MLAVVLAVVDCTAITRRALCTTDTGTGTACYVFVYSASMCAAYEA
jgi:hypothetical protein